MDNTAKGMEWFSGWIMNYARLWLKQSETYQENVFIDWCHLSIHLLDLDENAYWCPTLAFCGY
jgi:hypothetical protein